MENFLKKLNEANAKRNESGYIKIEQLTPDRRFSIIDVEKSTNQYGERVKCCLKLENQNTWVYLGEEYTDFFAPEVIKLIKTGAMKFDFIFKEKIKRKNFYEIVPAIIPEVKQKKKKRMVEEGEHEEPGTAKKSKK